MPPSLHGTRRCSSTSNPACSSPACARSVSRRFWKQPPVSATVAGAPASRARRQPATIASASVSWKRAAISRRPRRVRAVELARDRADHRAQIDHERWRSPAASTPLRRLLERERIAAVVAVGGDRLELDRRLAVVADLGAQPAQRRHRVEPAAGARCHARAGAAAPTARAPPRAGRAGSPPARPRRARRRPRAAPRPPAARVSGSPPRRPAAAAGAGGRRGESSRGRRPGARRPTASRRRRGRCRRRPRPAPRSARPLSTRQEATCA